jgi:hypothetical protein
VVGRAGLFEERAGQAGRLHQVHAQAGLCAPCDDPRVTLECSAGQRDLVRVPRRDERDRVHQGLAAPQRARDLRIPQAQLRCDLHRQFRRRIEAEPAAGALEEGDSVQHPFHRLGPEAGERREPAVARRRHQLLERFHMKPGQNGVDPLRTQPGDAQELRHARRDAGRQLFQPAAGPAVDELRDGRLDLGADPPDLDQAARRGQVGRRLLHSLDLPRHPPVGLCAPVVLPEDAHQNLDLPEYGSDLLVLEPGHRPVIL